MYRGIQPGRGSETGGSLGANGWLDRSTTHFSDDFRENHPICCKYTKRFGTIKEARLCRPIESRKFLKQRNTSANATLSEGFSNFTASHRVSRRILKATRNAPPSLKKSEHLMKKKRSLFSKGDWIVHRLYGVGQIRGIESKQLNAKKRKYYRVKTDRSTFWLLVGDAENQRVRPVAPAKELLEAIEILNDTPGKMDRDYKKRQKRIKQVLSEGFLVPTSELLRDMSARHQRKKLTAAEQVTLDLLKKRLTEEWSAVMSIKPSEADRQLNQILKDL